MVSKLADDLKANVMYDVSTQEAEDLQNRFTYHSPKEDKLQAERYSHIRNTAHQFAEMILSHCPRSRETSLALTKLEEAVMWANASIARNE